MTWIRRMILTAATAALTLLCNPAVDAWAAPLTPQDVAWMEALILASVPPHVVARPDVSFRGPADAGSGTELTEYVAEANEVMLYHEDPSGCHCLLVHQFLHAIFHQIHSGEAPPAGSVSGDAEAWVMTSMGWRASSNTCRLSPDPHRPVVSLERSASLHAAGSSSGMN